MQRKTLFVLFLLLALCVAPLQALADSNPVRRGAVDQAKAEAETLLKARKYLDAYDIYSRLLREAPDDDAVNLGLARAALAASRPNQAIMAYERLLAKYPGESQLYKEVAQAYAAIGDNQTAKRYLDMEASGVSEAEAGDLMGRFSRSYDRFQVHGKLRAGALFDSNANQGPARDTMNLGNYRNVTAKGVSEKSTFGAYLGGQVDLGYRLEQTGPWWLVGDVNFFIRGNENPNLEKLDSQYSQWYRASAGIRHLGANTLLDVRFKGEVFDYEFFQSVYAFGPEATFVYAPTPSFQLISRGGIDKREYSQDSIRNGYYGYIGQYARLFFTDEQHEVMVGGRYLYGNASRKYDYGYDGWEASAAFRFKLPYGFEFSPGITYTEEYYHGPGTALEVKDREDKRLRLGTGLSYAINENWSVEASYFYTDNVSESNIYEYDRHLVTVGLAWSF